MRVLVAPDSYKGTLSALEVSRVVARVIRTAIPAARVRCLPMADGGEGTVASVVNAANGTLVTATVTGPNGAPVQSQYGLLQQRQAAILEVANICGLTMVTPQIQGPLRLSTYGVGEMIRLGLDAGIRTFMVGLGGSATNDGGLGMLQALGADVLNHWNEPVPPTAQGLAEVAHVNLRNLDGRLAECRIHSCVT